MQQTFQAKVTKLEHVYENGRRCSIYTLEYEDNGNIRQITTDKEPSSWIEEDAAVEITVEDGKLLWTDIKKSTQRHNLFMIACLLLFCAVVLGWFALIVLAKSNVIRAVLIAAAAAAYIFLHRSPK